MKYKVLLFSIDFDDRFSVILFFDIQYISFKSCRSNVRRNDRTKSRENHRINLQ